MTMQSILHMLMRTPLVCALLPVFIAAAVSAFASAAHADQHDAVSGATPYANSDINVSAYVLHQLETDLDHGGSFSKTSYSISADYKLQDTGPIDLGLGAGYKMHDYSFDGTTFAGIDPWDKAHIIDIGTSIHYRLSDGWTIWAKPSIMLSMQDGAELSDSITYGGIFAVSGRINNDIRAGIGTRVSVGMEDTKVIPIILLSWDITERLSLSNPRPQGPASPAGLELSYAVPGAMEIAGGAAYNSSRFRLNDKGTAPDGIVENKAVPVWASASKTIWGNTDITLFAGMTIWGKLTVKDRDGVKISSDEYGISPLMSLNISSRF